MTIESALTDRQKAEIELFKPVADSFIAAAEKKKDGTYSIPKANYLKVLEENGVTEDIAKAMHKANRTVVGGLMLASAQLTEQAVAEAQKAGESVKDVQSKIEIATLDGYFSATNSAYSVNRIPPRPGAPADAPTSSVAFGQTTVRSRVTSAIPTAAAIHVSERVAALVGPLITE